MPRRHLKNIGRVRIEIDSTLQLSSYRTSSQHNRGLTRRSGCQWSRDLRTGVEERPVYTLRAFPTAIAALYLESEADLGVLLAYRAGQS